MNRIIRKFLYIVLCITSATFPALICYVVMKANSIPFRAEVATTLFILGIGVYLYYNDLDE